MGNESLRTDYWSYSIVVLFRISFDCFLELFRITEYLKKPARYCKHMALPLQVALRLSNFFVRSVERVWMDSVSLVLPVLNVERPFNWRLRSAVYKWVEIIKARKLISFARSIFASSLLAVLFSKICFFKSLIDLKKNLILQIIYGDEVCMR